MHQSVLDFERRRYLKIVWKFVDQYLTRLGAICSVHISFVEPEPM